MIVKAAIVGLGYMGHFHLGKLRALDGVAPTAVFDVDENRLTDARAMGLNVYHKFEELLNDEEISLVLICTPNHLHAEYAEKLLRHGKNVMCEKPVAMNAPELEGLIRTAQETGRIFTVHQNRRWDRDFLTVQKVLEDGEIGQATTIQSNVFGQRGVCFGWRADPRQGGGMLLDWGVHLIDQALMLFPRECVVSVQARLLSILTPDVEDYFEIRLRFEGGAEAHLAVGTFALETLPRWFVFGDRGTLKIDTFDPKTAAMKRIRQNVQGFDSMIRKDATGPSRTMAPLLPEFLEELSVPVTEDCSQEYHRNLVAAVLGKEAPHVQWPQMLRVMKIVDTARNASATNSVVRKTF